MENGLDGDQWTLGATKNVTMEQLWDWAKLECYLRSRRSVHRTGEVQLIREGVMVQFGKDHVEEILEHLPGPCEIYPQ